MQNGNSQGRGRPTVNSELDGDASREPPTQPDVEHSAGSRGASPEFEREFRQHAQGLGGEIGNAGRKLIGKVERAVRNPKNYTHSEDPIREDVRDRLSASPRVDPSELEVTVSAGEVTLTGTVSNREMKIAAEEIARSVAGVHDVHNELRVN